MSIMNYVVSWRSEQLSSGFFYSSELKFEMLDKMAESVKVIVRCRPMNDREREMGCKNILLLDGERCTCSISNPDDITAPAKTFTFDSVYSVVSTTEQIYNDIVYPLVEGVLEGYNSTVFAYGQTGCGKSHTMQGSLVPASSRGIIPRSFEHIFEAISVVENKKFLVVASYLEIYNEEIRDLLSADCKKKLELKDSPQTGVCVPELTKHAVQNVEECEKLMEEGWKNRSTGSTLMNKDSSRSHSIFTIALEMVSNHNAATIRRGKLNLVDLAGSERQAKTGATGERLKEATKINLSLMALGNVISALVDGKSKHIPYRDSKLTRLLQDSLGGNTKTLMIACLSPASNNYDESLCTLRYANRAKNIKNKPRINEDPKDAMLREYQREIEKLKTMLNQGPIPGSVDEIRTGEGYSSRSESEKLKNDYENEMLRLKQEYEREQNSKKKLQQDMDDLKRHYEEQLESLQKKSHGQLENVSHQQVLERLRKLQASMIGGEKADDKELKEKRLKKKKAAERRLEALASVLSKVNDEDGVMLRVYDDIQEELKAKTETLRKYKQRIRGMEREITDLQSEFENERTDYLETIRRSERQLQLYQQIAEKMVAVLKKECNYANLDEIRQEAVWSDDLERWKLPELIVAKTKLPPAGQNSNGNWMTMAEKVYKTNSTASEDNAGNWNNLSERLSSGSPSESSSIFQRLKREAEDLPANYFKPRRANELLSKAREDASKAFSTWKEYTNKNKLRHLGSGQQIGKIPNPLNLYGNIKSNSAGDADVKYGLNGSWNGNWDDSNSWGDLTKKPLRLEALPLLKMSPIGWANGSDEWEREDTQKFLQSLLEAIDTLLMELLPNRMKMSKRRGWNTKGP